MDKERIDMVDFRDFKRRFESLPPAWVEPIAGLNEAEIHDLEEYAGCHLPSVYTSFLKLFGSQTGSWLAGSDCCMSQPDRLRLKEVTLQYLTRKHAGVTLPSDAFVFFMHQGYIFQYFVLSEGDDPPVYSITDKHRSFEKISPTLSDWFQRQFDAHAKIVDMYPDAPSGN